MIFEVFALTVLVGVPAVLGLKFLLGLVIEYFANGFHSA